VASVLAIAVLGIVMAKAFGVRLDALLQHVSLPAEILQELRGSETKLAGLPVPAGADEAARVAIQGSVREAFVFGFRMVIGICAGLALASAAVAGVMIPKERSGGIF
jgi:hypothetical protein